ncbi:MAG TPA: hypothetical protein VHY78_06205, partial [Stellaceae bacterium]|nr:hypothetical protein [Stellaceae bacterium]
MIAKTDDLPIVLLFAFPLSRSPSLGGARERRHVRPGRIRPSCTREWRIGRARPAIPPRRVSLGRRRPAAGSAGAGPLAIIGSSGVARRTSFSLI